MSDPAVTCACGHPIELHHRDGCNECVCPSTFTAAAFPPPSEAPRADSAERRREDFQRIGGVAFRAGWAAACMTIADEVRRAGASKEAAAAIRKWATHPPDIEVADLATPEGQAMKAQSETVMMESFPRRKA